MERGAGSAGARHRAAPLSERERRRGRWLAIASHPAGNTFRLAFTMHLPTLALVSLGASEQQVGLQSAFVFLFVVLQLPTLRLVARASKRSILLASHAFALAAAVPLVFWDRLPAWSGGAPVGLALMCFGLVAVGVCVGETVWFPLLRAYVEPTRIGRFFGALRTGWHLALIGFYLFAAYWLRGHPGDFATLFGVGLALGIARIFLVAWLPERDERTGERIRVREALALVRDPALRSYLVTLGWSHAMRLAAVPFVIVMMRRVGGFDDGEVVQTTVAFFAGGVASLFVWGLVADRTGPLAILRATTVAQAVLLATLVLLAPGPGALGWMIAWFFALAVLASGHGVADTLVLFELTPPEAPARTLVIATVVVRLAGGLAPILAGVLLDATLPDGDAASSMQVYHGFFAGLAALLLLALVPLSRLARARSAAGAAPV